jgi:hypothetical protein
MNQRRNPNSGDVIAVISEHPEQQEEVWEERLD